MLGLAAAAWLARRRAPALTAAIAAFVVISLPMLGVVQNGPQIAADRYTYHAAPALAMLGATAFLMLPRPRALISVVGLAAVLGILGALTWRQTEFWQRSRDAVVSRAPGGQRVGDRAERDGERAIQAGSGRRRNRVQRAGGRAGAELRRGVQRSRRRVGPKEPRAGRDQGVSARPGVEAGIRRGGEQSGHRVGEHRARRQRDRPLSPRARDESGQRERGDQLG